jgi:hypothetical protein
MVSAGTRRRTGSAQAIYPYECQPAIPGGVRGCHSLHRLPRVASTADRYMLREISALCVRSLKTHQDLGVMLLDLGSGAGGRVMPGVVYSCGPRRLWRITSPADCGRRSTRFRTHRKIGTPYKAHHYRNQSMERRLGIGFRLMAIFLWGLADLHTARSGRTPGMKEGVLGL